MYRRKLIALGFHHPDHFSLNDENAFRNFVVWLEDKVICLYDVEDRFLLRETSRGDWDTIFNKYLDDLKCPVNREDRKSVTGWLLSHGIKLKYHENATLHNSKHKERQERRAKEMHSPENFIPGTLGAITGDHPDLKAGVASLSKLLGIPQHHDHITTLQAVNSIIKERLTSDKVEASVSAKKKKEKSGDFLPISEVDLGFHVNDPAVCEAAKILRLLHLHELRHLQTQINKAIVLVQNSTANPKTDQSLGKVGR